MDFCKKVLLLKESTFGFSSSTSHVGGIVRIEYESGVSDLSVTLVNVKPLGGEYYLFLVFDKKTAFSFPLGKNPFSFRKTVDFIPPVSNGVSAGLIYLENNLPTVVAFAKTENFLYGIKDFKKFVFDKFADPLPQANNCKEEYDDEIVATENYFDFDKDFSSKLGLLKDFDYVKDKDALFTNLSKTKENQKTANNTTCDDETDAGFVKAFSVNNPYYLSVKKDIENIFSSFPLEEHLTTLSQDGKWAKINYSADKYYVVGVLKESGKEKYICYGVPAPYSPTPPKELEGFCSFVPKSVFNLKGDGYFIMFQDAVTGKCVKPK